MATKNPRINVTLDKETAKYLTLMAKKRKKTISVTARELIESALE
ncbi:MAG: ribbon-helix-helix protein, CopG family, partial [bacterium]